MGAVWSGEGRQGYRLGPVWSIKAGRREGLDTAWALQGFINTGRRPGRNTGRDTVWTWQELVKSGSRQLGILIEARRKCVKAGRRAAGIQLGP